MSAKYAPTVTAADSSWLHDVLVRRYPLTPIAVARRAGETQTDNFTVRVDRASRRYFSKVSRPGCPAHEHLVLELEQQARMSRSARLPAELLAQKGEYAQCQRLPTKQYDTNPAGCGGTARPVSPDVTK